MFMYDEDTDLYNSNIHEIIENSRLFHLSKLNATIDKIPEEFRKAQTEVEKKNEKPMSQRMFKVI